jgi:hypothetical protein
MLRWTVIAAMLAAPIAHPDFSGTWILDLSRSDAGQSTPDRASYQVVQHGDSISYDRESSSVRGTLDSHVVLGADGKVWTNVVAQNGQDVPTQSIVTWHGDTLVIHSSGAMQSSTVDTDEWWVLAAQGQALLMHREVSVNGQLYASTNLYFNRKS